MFTSSQQLQDAKANGKVFTYLAIAGALAGACLGPMAHFKSLSEPAQAVVTPGYVVNFNLARVHAFANEQWLSTRLSAYQKVPEIAAQIDAFPSSIAAGAATGGLVFPLSIAAILALVRSKKKPKQQQDRRGKSVSDFLQR